VINNFSYPGRQISTFADLDAAFVRAQAARERSEKEFLQELSSFWFYLPPPKVIDPWSEAYKEHWFAVHKIITGHAYNPVNEFFDFDVAHHPVF